MDNRSTILDCALNLFANRGFDAVGVQEVAESAGITKPTLYHYFGSKTGLLEAILETNFEPLLAAIEDAAAYYRDLPYTLNQVALTYLHYANKNSTFYRMQLSLTFSPRESKAYKAVFLHQERIHQTLETLFRNAANDHGNMIGRHTAYTLTFIGMINSYIALSLNNQKPLEDQLVFQAVHQFMYGIYS
jgi:AcrR family transcriptional regulator